MFSPCSEHGIFMYWSGKSIDNLLIYCGLVDARISASDKDLPVCVLRRPHHLDNMYVYILKKLLKKKRDSEKMPAQYA